MKTPPSSKPHYRDKLSMLDEYGGRKFIIPAEVRPGGYFHEIKKKVHFVFLLIFLLMPWIYFQGEQLVQFDIPNRKFQLFGVQLLAHDAPLIFFVLFAFTIGLALVTALFGRVWCGWACPQTVFIESVYRKIEIWTEGKYLERRQLRTAPWSFSKFRKISLKWFFYTLASLFISHSFLAYWTGSYELLAMMGQSPSENQTYFLLVMSVTGLLLFNFGWFREQFCLIVCPYGKFQSVLMDSHSKTVMYDEKRSDCVDCNRCVQVCPTGIDIRNGIQMECIACTACIDACDEIMTKVKKPQGLIRYKALTEKPIKWLRSRVVAYLVLFILSMGGLVYSLANSEQIRFELLRGKDFPYVVRTNEQGEEIVQNHFKIRIENKKNIKVDSLNVVVDNDKIKIIGPVDHISLQEQQLLEIPVFIEAPKKLFQNGYLSFQLKVISESEKEKSELVKKSLRLVGPVSLKY